MTDLGALLGEPERAQHYHVYGKKIIIVDDDQQRRQRPTTSQARAMASPRTSRMSGAPPLLAMNGRGYTDPCAYAQWELCKWTVNPAYYFNSGTLGSTTIGSLLLCRGRLKEGPAEFSSKKRGGGGPTTYSGAICIANKQNLGGMGRTPCPLDLPLLCCKLRCMQM